MPKKPKPYDYEVETRKPKPRGPETENTCGKVHRHYWHGNNSTQGIAHEPQDALYYCTDTLDCPNPMHGSEYARHLKLAFLAITDSRNICTLELTKPLLHTNKQTYYKQWNNKG